MRPRLRNNSPFKVYSPVKSAVTVDCATVRAAALGEAAGQLVSHSLRLTTPLRAEELALRQLLHWQM